MVGAHLPGGGHEVRDLDGRELAEPLGLAGHLHGDRVPRAPAGREDRHVEQRRPVLVQLRRFCLVVENG